MFKTLIDEIGRLIKGAMPFAIVNSAPNGSFAALLSYRTGAAAEAAGHELILQKGAGLLTADQYGNITTKAHTVARNHSAFSVAGAIQAGLGSAEAGASSDGNMWSYRGSFTADNTARVIKANQGSNATLYLVSGNNGGNYFADVVLSMGSVSGPSVIASQTNASPAARTYSASSETLKLQMNGGGVTYNIVICGFGTNEVAHGTAPTFNT
jgi:hypothetical protein